MATAGTSKEALAMAATQMGFTCSISQEVMEDPVVAADGFSYERSSIVGWLAGHSTSPLTNEELAHKMLTPNRNLRSNIQTWLEVQAGESRGAKRRRTSAEEIAAFLGGLEELVRTESVAEIVGGLRLGDGVELHTRVLDALCRCTFGGRASCARIVAGGGLEASVAAMRAHMRPSGDGWAAACLDACTILDMVVLHHGSDRPARLAAIDRAGGIVAVADLVQARHMDAAMLMRALNVLCQFLDVVTLPTAVRLADAVVGGVVSATVKGMAAHGKNLGVLTSACRTLGELARVAQGRGAEATIAKIVEAGGVLAVVRAVEGNLSGGDKADRHVFLLVACSALHVFLLDAGVRQGAEAGEAMQVLCGVIRKHSTLDYVVDAAASGLLAAAGTCAEKKAAGHQGLGGLRGLMLVLHKNLARKASALVAATVQHALRLLATFYMGEATADDGHAATVVGVMKAHAGSLEIQVAAVLFLRQVRVTPGVDAAIVVAGGIEALVEGVRRHGDGRLQTGALMTLGLLLNAGRVEEREARVLRARAAGGVEVLLGVVKSVPGSVARLPGGVQNALVVLCKLSASDAHFEALVAAGGVGAMASTVFRYHAEWEVKACVGVLARVYCRGSGLGGGLSFADVEGVVAAKQTHMSCAHIQQSACGVVGMYLRCLGAGAGDGVEKGAGTAEQAGAEGEWCMRAVLASMQRHAAHAGVLEAGFKALVAFVKLKHAVGDGGGGVAAVLGGGGAELALGALLLCEGGPGLRSGALQVLAVLCVGNGPEREAVARGGVLHALESLRSGVGVEEAQHALILLRNVAGTNAEVAGLIAAAGGVRAVLGAMPRVAVVGGRGVIMLACEVLAALTAGEAECAAFALAGGVTAVVRGMRAHEQDAGLFRLLELLCRVSRVAWLRASVATGGGVAAVVGFVGLGVEGAGALHESASELLGNLAAEGALRGLVKAEALAWVEAVLAGGVGVGAEARGRYAAVAEVLCE